MIQSLFNFKRSDQIWHKETGFHKKLRIFACVLSLVLVIMCASCGASTGDTLNSKAPTAQISIGDESNQETGLSSMTIDIHPTVLEEVDGQVKLEQVWTGYLDTVSTLTLYAPTKEAGTAYIKHAGELLLKYHMLFDTFRAYDHMINLKSVNDQRGGAPIKVDPELIEMLHLAKKWSAKTNGRFNPMLGELIQTWRDHMADLLSHKSEIESGQMSDFTVKLEPSQSIIEKAKHHANLEDLIIDDAQQTVYIRDDQTLVDVGAVAKGFTVEKIAQALIKDGVTNAMLSFGGNVRTIGVKLKGEPWRIGVENPYQVLATNDQTSAIYTPDYKKKGAEKTALDRQAAANASKILTVVEATDHSIVTSGIYQRYVKVNDQIYHHIIDPTTFKPSNRYDSVTVITKDSGVADVLSTALFNMSIEEGQALVDELEDVEALWVQNHRLIRSKGFSKYESLS